MDPAFGTSYEGDITQAEEVISSAAACDSGRAPSCGHPASSFETDSGREAGTGPCIGKTLDGPDSFRDVDVGAATG